MTGVPFSAELNAQQVGGGGAIGSNVQLLSMKVGNRSIVVPRNLTGSRSVQGVVTSFLFLRFMGGGDEAEAESPVGWLYSMGQRSV